MLPSILARQVRTGVEDHLRASFSPTTRGFDRIIEDFIVRPDTLLKGPWISVEMPFRRSEQTEEFFPSIPMGFRPYKHQEKAFRRLAGDGRRSTLIATGTGSGKTECFTLPILDACVRAKGRPGIKAIIIYPMNALAADQARRFASIVAKNPALAGVRVGMYADERPENPTDEMTPTAVIDMREALVRDPPDILLTNYKMLDYMLVRPDERELWAKNGPDTLRYLVVDELHTFDGAQGTDLACLIRRLKSRLGMSKGSLCCVGTSATLGGGAAKASEKESDSEGGALGDLLGYATSVFDESFDRDAVVTEDRQSVDEYLSGIDVTAFDIPSAATVRKLANNAADMGRISFLAEAFARWFGEVPPSEVDGHEWRVSLGKRLDGHAFLQGLLRITQGKPMVVGDICREVVRSKHFKGWSETDVESLLDTFLALVGHARRVDEPGSKHLRPFLNLRHQLWLREMRRMVASVGYKPRLTHFDDLLLRDQERSLPVVHCRSCGGAGWVTMDPADTNKPIWAEPKEVYSAYFDYSSQVRFLFLEEPIVRGRRTKTSQSTPATLCSECLCYEAGDAEAGQACPRCQADADKRTKIFIYQPGHFSGKELVPDHDCAFCRSPNGMGILGAQSVTLVSGMVGTIFGSEFNDDPKLLTFSDSVQDAAHRAAVLQARNASTVFRAGLSRFVCEAVTPPSLENSLKDAPTSMRIGQPEAEDFVATYMPADLEWWQDYESLLRDDALPAGSRLADDLERRLSWETFSELTFKSRLGNTIERSGVAVAHVDAESVKKLASELSSRLADELGAIWSEVGHPVIRRFLLGLLDHMRARGAVATNVTRQYVEREANWFAVVAMSGRVLPNYARRAPKPVFPCRGNIEGFENVAATEGSDGWYRSWFHACFDREVTLASGQSPDFYALVFRLMENLGIAERMTIGGRDPDASAAWGLNPERVAVFSEPSLLKCTTCGNSHRVPQKYSGLWEGVRCTRTGCNDILADVSESDLSRYRAKGLTTGRIKRVVSAEHTSLLDREERFLVESRFMSDTPRTWYPNLLAATPTLEMGINIGDLSTLVLCSVPPEQSNYVQRIGRTGRRDGNSLNVTVAMARSHDMWYWTDPAEMITGEVKTPGVHLKAVAILRRQYAAFTLDKWVETKGSGVRSYGRVGDALRAIETGNRAMFPLCWFDFVAQNADKLFEDFAALFPEVVEDRDDFERLHGFAHGGEVDGLAHLVACEYGDIAAEIQAVVNMIDEAKAVIKKLNKNAAKDLDHDEQIERLEFEIKALRRIRDEIKKLDNLGFMTERGVLPNYAFPSAPIALKSILSRLEPRDGKSKEALAADAKKDRDALILEYSRPSSSALSEFAPGARFYAKGRKVRIDQIDLTASPIEYWRVCPDCVHMERASQANETGACPSCGSEMWADVGSRRPMIRLKQVLATGSDRSARIADDGDEREVTRFDRAYLPAIDRDQIVDAYAIDDGSFPFGFEFLRQCTFREFNFGEKHEAPTGQKIGGTRRSGHGFEICSSCGKVQDPRIKPRDGEVGLHLARCKEAKTATDKTFVSVVYIFREFASEAVRILLPLATSYDDSAVDSLSAAIELGLKLHFKGKVSHLKSTVVEVKEGPLTRRYLFVYDTVPGGTGYLKQVASKPDEMLAVFEKARAHMVACACNEDPDKDGCPRCIRSYGAVLSSGGVSRDTAVGILNEIVAEWERLTRVFTVSDVKLNRALESELEQAFVERLRSSVKAAQGVFKKIVMAGKPGYFVKLGETTWNVELQCVLHDRFSNVPATRADLVFWPAVPEPGTKPLAVYLDGWQFHAPNVAEDLALRQKLVRSGHMNVWSATWDDVVKKDAAETKSHYWEPLASSNAWVGQLENVCGGNAPAFDALDFVEQRPFEQLLSYLRDPSPDVWRPRARALALAWLLSGIGEGKDRVAGLIAKFAGEEARTTLEDGADPVRWGMVKVDGVGVVATAVHGWKPAPGPDACDLTVAVGVQHNSTESKDAKFAWNGALRLLNIAQFLPYFYVGCVGGIELSASLRATGAEAASDDWDEVESYVLSSMMAFVAALKKAKVPPPEVYFEAYDHDNNVLGTMELAWPDAKTGLVLDPALVNAFPGWKIIVHQGGAEVPPAILEMAP